MSRAESDPSECIRTENIEADRITAKEVVVCGGNGHKAVLSGTGEGVGLWLEGPRGNDGALVAVYMTPTQACVGLYRPGDKSAEGVNVGLTVPTEGDEGPSVQFSYKGELLHLSIEQVRKLFDK